MKRFLLILAGLICLSGCRQFKIFANRETEQPKPATQRVQLPIRPTSKLVTKEEEPAPSANQTSESAEPPQPGYQRIEKIDIGIPPDNPSIAPVEHPEKITSAPQDETTAEDEPVEHLAPVESVVLVEPEPVEIAASAPPPVAIDESSQSSSESSFTALYADLASGDPARQVEACAVIAQQGDPNHIDHLTPLLAHRNVEVCKAAAGALAVCGPWVHPKPLEQLLLTGDLPRQRAAALALCQLGSPLGPAAIEQMSYSLNPEIRVLAANAAGELADPLFAPMLIRLLNDPTKSREAALAALPQCMGLNVAAPEDSVAASAEKWRQWYASGGRLDSR